MAISLSTPVTGSTQTGLTTPTYTLAVDQPPDVNAKQWLVSALGGTQAGVLPHSISQPFTVAFFKPKNPQTLAPVNPVTNVLSKVPMNTYKVVTRKGVIPLVGQAPRTALITTSVEAPAGADTADPNSLRAMLSAHIGALQQISAGLGDTVLTGSL